MQLNINIKTKKGKDVKFLAVPSSNNNILLLIDEADLFSNNQDEEINNLGMHPVNIPAAIVKKNNEIIYEDGPIIGFFSHKGEFKNKAVTELFKKYNQELHDLETLNPGGCSPCKKGALMRKYKALLAPYYLGQK